MDIVVENVPWVAGLLEGEGSFMAGPPSQPHRPAIRCSMTDLDVMEKLAHCLGGVAVTPLRKAEEHHKQAWMISIRGIRAVEVMKVLYPHMGVRRRQQIDKALACYQNLRGKTSPEQREEIIRRFDSGESAKGLAAEFGVTHWAIYRMRNSARK